MAICSNCGKSNTDGAIYCGKCGQKLTPEMPSVQDTTHSQQLVLPERNRKAIYSEVLGIIAILYIFMIYGVFILFQSIVRLELLWEVIIIILSCGLFIIGIMLGINSLRHSKLYRGIAISGIILSTFALVSLIPLIVFFKPVNRAEEAWSISLIDRDFGEFSSMVLDSSGNPHVAYLDKHYNLKYARLSCSKWLIEKVDSAPYGGFSWLSLALDTLGNPNISYTQFLNGALKYARWTGSAWHTEMVDSGNIFDIIDNSIAIDDAGYPHISYECEGDFNTNLKYARWDGSKWLIDTVDLGGMGNSIALDVTGNPHISYRDDSNKTLKYARWDGSKWLIQTVDSARDYGGCTSIALDTAGNPHISYSDTTNHNLKYARWTGADWHIQVFDSSIYGGDTSIALDAADNPCIGYCNRYEGGLKYARWNGSSWLIEIVDKSGGNTASTSIALDAGGYAHICYSDASNNDLIYAVYIGAK